LGLCLTVLTVSAANACTKRLRWSEDPPYSMRLPDGQISGLTVALAQAVLGRLGCKVELLELPFARALADLQAGQLDMIDGVFVLPERQAYAYFSIPSQRARNVVFVRAADLPRVNTLELADLHQDGWQFGVQVGVAYGPAFAALLKDPGFQSKLQRVPRRSSLWQMLVRERVDVVMADELTGAHEIAAAGLAGQIVPTRVVVSEDPVAMAFSKATTDPAFVSRYNQVLQAMRRDGSYQALMQRYGLRIAAKSAHQPDRP